MDNCDFCDNQGIWQDCDGEWWVCEHCELEDSREMSDAQADHDTLVSVGWGSDEDYGYYGGEDW